MRVATEEDVLQALGRQLGIAYLADLKPDDVDGELAPKIPIGFAKQHRLLPLREEAGTVLVATADPLDVWAMDDLRSQLGGDTQVAIQPILHPSGKILDLINQVYGRKHDSGGSLGQGEEEEDGAGGGEELVDILDVTDEAPIIRWVNSLLFNAVKERASDIHIEPGEKEVMVRYRIDGVLYETRRANRQFMPSIVSRVKIMAGLNIAGSPRTAASAARSPARRSTCASPPSRRSRACPPNASPSASSIGSPCCTIWPTSGSAMTICEPWTISFTAPTACCS